MSVPFRIVIKKITPFIKSTEHAITAESIKHFKRSRTSKRHNTLQIHDTHLHLKNYFYHKINHFNIYKKIVITPKCYENRKTWQTIATTKLQQYFKNMRGEIKKVDTNSSGVWKLRIATNKIV